MLLRSRTGGASTGSRVASILTFISTLIAAKLTTIVFVIDVVLVPVIRHRVKNETDGFLTLSWGNAVRTLHSCAYTTCLY
jgi:hypothetical protein